MCFCEVCVSARVRAFVLAREFHQILCSHHSKPSPNCFVQKTDLKVYHHSLRPKSALSKPIWGSENERPEALIQENKSRVMRTGDSQVHQSQQREAFLHSRHWHPPSPLPLRWIPPHCVTFSDGAWVSAAKALGVCSEHWVSLSLFLALCV